jgi:hypothetical protein
MWARKALLIGSTRADEATGCPAVRAQEAGDPKLVLPIGHRHVEIPAVDALPFQGDVVAEDVGDCAWESPDELRTTGLSRSVPLLGLLR